MELCSKEQIVNIKVATLCFVDSPANPWPSLNELHDVVT